MPVEHLVNSLEAMLQSIKPAVRGSLENIMYPDFYLRVGVIKYRPPRHPFFDFIRDMGSEKIPRVLEHTPLRRAGVLTFVFPERHLSVHEQRDFMQRLATHPEVLAGEVQRVDIITSSPIMLTDFLPTHQVEITWPDDKKKESTVDDRVTESVR